MQTQVIKLCCQGCGADLQVTEDVRFVTCNYCQSKLEIVRDASVTHTRVLEKLQRTTERIAGNLRVIELQNDLERMDREWDATRHSMMNQSKDGQFYEPTEAEGMICGVFFGLVGALVAYCALANGTFAWCLPGFGLMAFGVWFAGVRAEKAKDFHRLKRRYQEYRQRMLALMEKERRR